LRKIKDEHSSLKLEDSLLAPLLKEYEDVFQPISARLSSKKEMAHIIPLENKEEKLKTNP
jgi:hypothetical protein